MYENEILPDTGIPVLLSVCRFYAITSLVVNPGAEIVVKIVR